MGLSEIKQIKKQAGKPGGSGGWRPLEKARYYWLLLKRMHGDPAVLARGVALGTFIGITPTIPLHTVTIVCLSPLLRASPFAAIVASLTVSNPLTIPLEYFASWKVGTMITGFNIPWAEVSALLHQVEHTDIWNASLLILHKSVRLIEAMIIGGVVLALPAAIGSYSVSIHFYRKHMDSGEDMAQDTNDTKEG